MILRALKRTRRPRVISFFAAEDRAFARCASCRLRPQLVLAAARLHMGLFYETWSCGIARVPRGLILSGRPRAFSFFASEDRAFARFASCRLHPQLVLAAARLHMGLF